MLNLELDEDGFLKEAEVKFRPVGFLVEGIFFGCNTHHVVTEKFGKKGSPEEF